MTSPPPATLEETIAAGDADDGKRLDVFLAERRGDLSRSRLKALITEGHLRDEAGVVGHAARKVRAGERYDLHVPPPEPAAPRAQSLPLEILHEDDHLIVLVKPAGLVVHPAPGHHDGTLVNALLAHCGPGLSGIGGVRRPGIVHRLDKEVSGVLVVAKDDTTHRGLAAQFSLHTVHRRYEAIVWGLPSPPRGRIEAPIGRHPKDRLRMAIVPTGKPAATRYTTVAAVGTRAARVEVELETGRTHQIRVHLSSRQHAILGDRVYGVRKLPPLSPELRERLARLDRILLHARELGFVHPVTGDRLTLQAEAPPLFDQILDLLRG